MNSANLAQWYAGGLSHYKSDGLPPQWIPKSKKNDKWKKDTMDALERIGLKQVHDNAKFKDLYRMINGELSYSELSEVIPQLREVDQALTEMDIPAFIKHYDVLGTIINLLVGEYVANGDKYNVTNIGSVSQNEYMRTKTDLVTRYIQENINKEITLKMINMGINPDPDNLDFENEEQKTEYIQMLQQKREELTPSEIEHHMNTSWKTKATVWGEETLEADRERFQMDEMDLRELTDFLLTGRCFRHFRIGYEHYEPETWSPLNTFFSQSVDTKNPADGSYVGRVHLYDVNKVLSLYGHKLNHKQKKQLLKGSEYYDSYSTDNNYTQDTIIRKNFHDQQIVPHRNYHDYNFALSVQSELGMPMGDYTGVDSSGRETHSPVFLPHRFNQINHNSFLARHLREDLDIRTDLLQVTEAYWVSYEDIGYLTFQDETGEVRSEIVSEELLKDFIKDFKLKQPKTVTLQELKENPWDNIDTIVWDARKVVYKGIKIDKGQGDAGEAIYLDVEPMETQVKGKHNYFDVQLPVVGLIDKGIAKKIEPFQIGHNVAMNQIYNLLEKELGMFYIFDVNFLPSEYKDWGDTEETLVHLKNLVRDTGLFPVDASRSNIKDGGSFNQFSAQNISFSSQIRDRIDLSEFYKNKAYEQIGINPQRLGAPTKYETAEGIKQSTDASYAQTEVYFTKFSNYKQNTLEMHLNVAQYAQKEGKDITVFRSKDDGSLAFLKFSDPEFPLRTFGILPVSNSKKRKELQTMKSFMMQNNTLGSDEMTFAKIFASETYGELMDASALERKRREKAEQEKRQHDQQMLQASVQAQEEAEVTKWEREEISKQRDRVAATERERIEALGRAVDNNASAEGIAMINNQTDLAIKQSKSQADIELGKGELSRKTEKDKADFQLGLAKIQEDMKKLEVEKERIASNERISQNSLRDK